MPPLAGLALCDQALASHGSKANRRGPQDGTPTCRGSGADSANLNLARMGGLAWDGIGRPLLANGSQ